ncbi:Glyoxalase-like domain protein [Methyloligella halotolerans]|uniref:Glyoxalase-like domain protein n=1 Tax=Methyloligella halotolerans TaxID=1177755 RepID=A0A1E2S0Y5_9HYPH|nr:VOC family protein [Methyloligella halotolerans]ODA68156.1 Glyoxalase-like domain protein [Methyloligella halotolerans]
MREQPKLPPLYPQICVLGGLDAIAFYEIAFGAECLVKLLDEDNTRVRYARMEIYGGEVAIHDEVPECNGAVFSPEDWPTSVALTITLPNVDDVNAAVERAVVSGAEVVFDVQDLREWCVRYGRVRDPFGHVWAFQAFLPCS